MTIKLDDEDDILDDSVPEHLDRVDVGQDDKVSLGHRVVEQGRVNQIAMHRLAPVPGLFGGITSGLATLAQGLVDIGPDDQDRAIDTETKQEESEGGELHGAGLGHHIPPGCEVAEDKEDPDSSPHVDSDLLQQK